MSGKLCSKSVKFFTHVITSKFSHLWLKTHIEHSIGLIQNEIFAIFKSDIILWNEIIDSTRCSNQNIATRWSFLNFLSFQKSYFLIQKFWSFLIFAFSIISLNENECRLKEKLTWEISVGEMEDSKCVAMGKRENSLPFQIIQMTQNEKEMILAFRRWIFNNRGQGSTDLTGLCRIEKI